jgi:hypothetical protein
VTRLALFMLAAVAAGSVHAAKLSCYEEPGTRKVWCIDEAAVRVNADTRAAGVFTGGPNGVRPTGHTFVVNCSKKISTLQDKDGVNFAAGVGNETPVSRALSGWICAAPKPKKDPRLRQF